MNDDTCTVRMGVGHWLALIACVLLFLVLRLPWIGHLLQVDEANTLLSVRAFASGGADFYSGWFWRRPPLVTTMLLLARPLEDGYIQRAEMMIVMVGTLNLLVLFLLNRRVFGTLTALASAFFLAVMPGANFFDVWVKHDCLCVLFGLLAIHGFLTRRSLLCGVALGLGFLAKEMALYYALAICVLWILEGKGRRPIREVIVVPILAVLASAWWYLFFSQSTLHVLYAVTGSPKRVEPGWQNPWYYFFEKLPVDLGYWGIAVTLVGVMALWVLTRRDKAAVPANETSAGILWPLALLIPSFLIISATRTKTPWYTIPLYPAFATLQALGLGLFLKAVDRAGRRFRWDAAVRRGSIAAAAILVVGASLLGAANRDYEDTMKRQYYWMWWGASLSRDTATMMNQLVGENERAMITPMFYWDTHERPCSVFTCYLNPFPVLIRRFDIPADSLIEDVKTHRLDWAMVSVPPGAMSEALIEPMIRKYGLYPLRLKGACIFKTDRIYKTSEANAPAHE